MDLHVSFSTYRSWEFGGERPVEIEVQKSSKGEGKGRVEGINTWKFEDILKMAWEPGSVCIFRLFFPSKSEKEEKKQKRKRKRTSRRIESEIK